MLEVPEQDTKGSAADLTRNQFSVVANRLAVKRLWQFLVAGHLTDPKT